MTAHQRLSLTTTPLSLLHNHRPVDSVFTLCDLEAEGSSFAIAAVGRPQDSMLSFSIVPGMLRIELHEPESVVLDTGLAVERRLPPTVVGIRHGAEVEPIRLLGTADADFLRAPVWVRRIGTPSDLVIAIGATTPAAFPLERDYCELSWTVHARPRSLRFTVTNFGSQVILRPSRRD